MAGVYVFVCCSLGPGKAQQYVKCANPQKFYNIAEDGTIPFLKGLGQEIEFKFLVFGFYWFGNSKMFLL
jgi:hypothetical protein